MPLRLPGFVATAGVLAIALTAGAATPALAHTESVRPSALGSSALGPAALSPELVEAIVDFDGSAPVGSVLEAARALGSADFPLGDAFSEPPSTPPSPVDPNITESEFIELENTDGAYEYWRVTSAAMQREIILEVVPSQVSDQEAAPVLYLLDGASTDARSTGWSSSGTIDTRLAGKHVHAVAPAGAYASYFADWDNQDPVVGNHKWETFLTEELPGIVESRLRTNGKAAVGGVSMGGQAAMHLAATYPDLYQGVMSFSAYFSTMDELGYQTIRGVVESRGGNLDNMWGPRGGERWQEHDTISRPEALNDTRVYFSSGAPVPGDADFALYGADSQDLISGLLLESGVLEGSRDFEKALTLAGVEHRVDYAETGLHNWPNFMHNFQAGWEYIRPALLD